MDKKAMVFIGKDIAQATQQVAQMGGTVLANYGQSILVRIAETHFADLRQAGYRVREIPEKPVVEIGGFTLDTSLPSALSTVESALEAALPSGRGAHIMYFVGPMHPDWRAELERKGVILVESVANDQFLVTFDGSKLPEIQALSYIETISPYYPALKINPDLLTADVQGALPSVDAIKPLADLGGGGAAKGTLSSMDLSRPPSSDEKQTGNLEVIVFNDQDPIPVVDAVRALGATVIRVSGPTIILYADQSLVADIAAIPQVKLVNPYRPPTLSNNVATGIIHADTLHNNHGLDGSGQIVAIADTGLDTGVDDVSMHDDFEGRIVSIHALGRPGDASDIHNHGTHVAGSVLGDGSLSNGNIQGMAPAAQVVFQSTMDATRHLGGLPDELGDGLFDVARDDGARIHTNSWSTLQSNGQYLGYSWDCDDFAFTNRDFLILFSAGNDAPLRVNSPGAAKNVLTVGASESVRPLPASVSFPASPTYPHGASIPNLDDEADDQNDVADFSCPGPAANNRRKPDVVAPGTWILSTRSSVSTNDCGPDGLSNTGDEDGVWTHTEAVGYGLPGQAIYFGGNQNTPNVPVGSGANAPDNYCYMSGTSMSTPITAGCCALLRQYLIEQRGHTPSAALLKAMVINGAVDMGMGVHDNFQGWGRVDLNNTLFPSSSLRVQFDDSLENAVATGDMRTYDVFVSSAAEPLVVTLVWRDPPGATIQNQLHLRVIHDASGVETTADDILDIRNNVQKVVIDPPQLGTYRIEVEGVNVGTRIRELAGTRQDYALVIANATGFSCNPSDIVQVIDRSGSMGFSGYMQPAKERAKQLVDILQINDHTGLVSFAASAVEDMALTAIDSQGDKDTAHGQIDAIASGGNTDLREGLERGLTTLGADAGRPRAIVFLSDGYHTEPPPYIDNQFLDDIAAANVRVFTIALGPASDFAVLNNIASRTGTGSVYTVESAADIHKLQEIYYNISGMVGCGGIAHLDSSPLGAGGHLEQQAAISNNTREAFFAAAWPQTGVEIEFTLRAPSGKTYMPATPEAFFYRGSSHVYYRIPRPEPGIWKLIVDHKGGGGDQQQVITTTTMADSDIHCRVELDPRYLYKDKVLLSLYATYREKPLIGGKAVATITYPTQSIDDMLTQYAEQLKDIKIDEQRLKEDKTDLELTRLGILSTRALAEGKDIYERRQVRIEITDDGRESDPKKDDGIYTAYFDPKAVGVAGNFSIQVSFSIKDPLLGSYSYTQLIPVYVPRSEPTVNKLVIKDIIVRRNRLWPYVIIGARVYTPDGSLATPSMGVSVEMLLSQPPKRVKSGDLPFYTRGGYYIWRFNRIKEGFHTGSAELLVKAELRGFLAAQARKRIVI